MRYAMVSSANSLTLEDSDSGSPFMLRCNSHGPKIEPCDTSGSTSTSSEDTPLAKHVTSCREGMTFSIKCSFHLYRFSLPL